MAKRAIFAQLSWYAVDMDGGAVSCSSSLKWVTLGRQVIACLFSMT